MSRLTSTKLCSLVTHLGELLAVCYYCTYSRQVHFKHNYFNQMIYAELSQCIMQRRPADILLQSEHGRMVQNRQRKQGLFLHYTAAVCLKCSHQLIKCIYPLILATNFFHSSTEFCIKPDTWHTGSVKFSVSTKMKSLQLVNNVST